MTYFQNKILNEANTKVINDKKFIVIKHNNRTDGLDRNGDPREMKESSICYFVAEHCDIFTGNTKEEIRDKIVNNNPDERKTNVKANKTNLLSN